MPVMTGADALVDSLVKEGVDIVFGLPGVQIMDAVDAIYRNGNIRWVSTRHEQTAAYMAYGYAQTTGKIGVAMVLPGPGALNTAAAIGTAYSASTPLLLISGQVESYHIGYNRGVLHELDEQIDIFRHLTKWCHRVSKAEEIPAALQEAIRQLKTGRPRPVEIEVPYDLWSKQVDISLPPVEKGIQLQADDHEIKKAADILRNACRPLILAGGGAAKADISIEITQLAESLNAPVIMTTEGQGIIHNEHPLNAGNFTLWLHPIFKQTDAILIVGSRLRASGNTQLEFGPDQTIIQIDHDPDELVQKQPAALVIKSDIDLTLKALLKECSGNCSSIWKKSEIIRLRTKIRNRLEIAAPIQLDIIQSIHNVLGDDAILVPDITNIGYWCDIAYPVNKTRTYVTSSYFATLGYAFPTALGAKIGNPAKHVVAICGDGGFPYASSELATAVQERLNIVILLFTNNGYGTVTGIQNRQFGGRFMGDKLHNPDYVKFAESFGAIGIRLANYRELEDTLRSVLSADRPVVIEIPVPQLDTPWDTLL